MGRERHLKPFKKGQSGNPNGRPPGYSPLFKDLTWEAVNTVVDLAILTPATEFEEKKKTLKLSKVQILLLDGLDGDDGLRVAESLLDRMIGKPKLAISSEIEFLDKVKRLTDDELHGLAAQFGLKAPDV